MISIESCRLRGSLTLGTFDKLKKWYNRVVDGIAPYLAKGHAELLQQISLGGPVFRIHRLREEALDDLLNPPRSLLLHLILKVTAADLQKGPATLSPCQLFPTNARLS